jgi:hypothetical protein
LELGLQACLDTVNFSAETVSSNAIAAARGKKGSVKTISADYGDEGISGK